MSAISSALAEAWGASVQELGIGIRRSERQSPSLKEIGVVQAWKHMTTELDPQAMVQRYLQSEPCFSMSQKSEMAVDILSKAHLLDDLHVWYKKAVETHMIFIKQCVDVFVPEFQECTKSFDIQVQEAPPREALNSVIYLLNAIARFMTTWSNPFSVLWTQTSSLNSFRVGFLNNLYHILPPTFSDMLLALFKAMMFSPEFSVDLTMGGLLGSSESQRSNPYRTVILPSLTKSSNDMASELEFRIHLYPTSNDPPYRILPILMERYDPILLSLLYGAIETKVSVTCAGVWNMSKLGLRLEHPTADDSMLKWVSDNLGEWVVGVYSCGGAGTSATTVGGILPEQDIESSGRTQPDIRKILRPTFSRFEHHVYKALATLRSKELFGIILEYPESLPALEDLKVCLAKTDCRDQLISAMNAQIRSRLLHPGASTKEIIDTYVRMIHSLRAIDTSGVLLSHCIDDVRNYLRTRSDTVKCITTSMLSPSSNSRINIASELGGASGYPARDLRLKDGKDEMEAEDYMDPRWCPEPREASAGFNAFRTHDIIQMLVGIYDSKEVFVRELQVFLASQFLGQGGYWENEMKNIALLKMRFGENALHLCDVMMKDMKNCQNITPTIQKVDPTIAKSTATIVSRLYWPPFDKSSSVKLPEQLEALRKTYSAAYTEIKRNKKLVWIEGLGSVNLTIERNGRKENFKVTVTQAAVIELFSRKKIWITEDLTFELNTDAALVKEALHFWSTKKVLKCEKRTLSEEEQEMLGVPSNDVVEVWEIVENESTWGADLDTTTGTGAMEVQAPEKEVKDLRPLWSSIERMLTNLGSLSTHRMHSALSRTISAYKGTSIDDFKAFLESMAQEGLLSRKGELWTLS